jgi:Peptidase A4 family
MQRRFVVVLVVLFAAVCGSVNPARAATRHRPVIGQAYASRSTLPATGAASRVSVRVRYATRCTIYADRKAGATAMGFLRVAKCGRGQARFTLPPIQNPSSTSIRVHFRVVAKGRGGTARQTFYIPEVGAKSPPPPGPAESPNWAGYIGVAGAPVTGVTGTFTVPTLNCTATPNASMSTWDGIGGVKAGEALIQTGVESDCINGVQADVPWWEIVGGSTNLPEQPFQSFPVRAGDTLTALVGQGSTGAWLTCLYDASTGEVGVMATGLSAGIGTGNCTSLSNYTPEVDTSTYSYAGGSTAEWIAEDPTASDGVTLLPLANFGTATFGGIGTSTSGAAVATEIVQGDRVLATPGPLSGNSFTVTYTGP